MTDCKPPHGLEFKAAPAAFATPPARSARRSADAAVWEGIVAATGVPYGGTTYAPGAIGR
jgi:hypothetical protein